MRHDSIGDVNGEVIGRVAPASLRHEDQVPRSVVGRASLHDRAKGKTTRDGSAKQELGHHSSEALSGLHRIYRKEQRECLL
jgi:hypothetical protein